MNITAMQTIINTHAKRQIEAQKIQEIEDNLKKREEIIFKFKEDAKYDVTDKTKEQMEKEFYKLYMYNLERGKK